MNFRSEEEIDHFLATFDSGTLPRYCWTHAAHIAMCTAQLWNLGTLDQIRAGIQQYNASQGTPASAYHETLTRFWIETVRAYLKDNPQSSRLDAVRNAIKILGLDSALPRKRYTFDVFYSPEARASWIPPDC